MRARQFKFMWHPKLQKGAQALEFWREDDEGWGRRLLVHLLLKAAVAMSLAEVFPALLSPS